MSGTGGVGVVGYPPSTNVGGGNPEALKYGKLWDIPAYRSFSPGQLFVHTFIQQAKPPIGSHVINCGCGTGREAVEMRKVGLKVTMLDFVRNCLDPDVKDRLSFDQDLKFLKHDLERPIPLKSEYAYCCDVMEHIPPDRVDLVLDNILRSSKWCFFSIPSFEDNCGKLIGEQLHLSVHSYQWWKDKLESLGCKISWSMDGTQPSSFINTSLFLVSAWDSAEVMVDAGVLNATEEQIKSNVEYNCQQSYTQVRPYEQNDMEVMLLGGGPSLALFEQDIHQKRKEGVKLITLNGTYNWALDHGLIPSATVVVDARPFNARFTHPPVPDCKYLLASQCHPSVFEGIPKSQVYIWHTMSNITRDIISKYSDEVWEIPGGCTVLLRAIPLLMLLGFRKFHLYGCDSCLVDTAHHSFSQPENDDQVVVDVMVSGGRVFRCNPWMVSQAQEFITLIHKLGNEVDMALYGDGLLAHIVTMGAELLDKIESGALPLQPPTLVGKEE